MPIRNQLSPLESYIVTVGYDITKFNRHIQLMLDGLSARGETTNDLLTNLFKGYNACSDHIFVRYAKSLQRWDGKYISPIEPMTVAEKNTRPWRSRAHGTRHPRARRRYWPYMPKWTLSPIGKRDRRRRGTKKKSHSPSPVVGLCNLRGWISTTPRSKGR